MRARTAYNALYKGKVVHKDGSVTTADDATEALENGWLRFGKTRGGQEVLDAYTKSLNTKGTITHARSTGSEDFFTQVKGRKSTKAAPKGKVVNSAAPTEEVTFASVKHLVDQGLMTKAAARKMLGL